MNNMETDIFIQNDLLFKEKMGNVKFTLFVVIEFFNQIFITSKIFFFLREKYK